MVGQVDLPRLKEGKVGGSSWSAFVLCPENGTDFSDVNYVEGWLPFRLSTLWMPLYFNSSLIMKNGKGFIC